MKKYLITIAILIISSAIIISLKTEIIDRKETSDIMQIETAVKMFYFHTGRLPTEEEGLSVLYKRPTDTNNKWKGPYLDQQLTDSWNRPYAYMVSSHKDNDFLIYSIGENGIDEKCKGDDYFIK